MAKVKFIGDPNDDFSGASRPEMFGVSFVKGEFVEVEDEKVLAKLRGHNHFVFEGEDDPSADPNHKAPENDGLAKMTVAQLEAKLDEMKVSYSEGLKKADLIEMVRGNTTPD